MIVVAVLYLIAWIGVIRIYSDRSFRSSWLFYTVGIFLSWALFLGITEIVFSFPAVEVFMDNYISEGWSWSNALYTIIVNVIVAILIPIVSARLISSLSLFFRNK
jgi:hypothetical protein